jgi:hypothetical protein
MKTLVRRYGRCHRTDLARSGARCRSMLSDWPCNQVKVPEISVAGPAIDHLGNAWEEDAGIKDLVAACGAPHAARGRAEGDFGCHHGDGIRASEKSETDICCIVQDTQS